MKREQGEPAGLASIEAERERAIALLTRHFADDSLSLEELERRMERVYQARTVAAVHDVTRDLAEAPRAAVAPLRSDAPADLYAREDERIVSVMAETVRRGLWRPARHLRVFSVMSETQLDLTEAQLGSGVTDIHLTGVMTAVKVIVPPGVRVVVQPTAFMSSVVDDAFDQPPLGTGAPVVRITGKVIMAELKVFVRRRERLTS